jgi:PAS domain S-box-containing protein
MGARIRAFDWGVTSLGPLEAWPDTLRAAVMLSLNSRFPMHIWWGPGLINIYNDAFVPVLGNRHPEALGRPAATIWPEAWSILQPQVEAVMERGESTWNDRAHVILARNGFSEETWLTWSYAPIRNAFGQVLGLHCVMIEETSRVLAEKSRERLLDERLHKEADERARSILESITEAFFALDSDWKFTYVNPQSLVVLGRPPAELIGKSLWDEYPGLYGSPFEPVYRNVAANRVADSIISYFPDHQRWYDVHAYPERNGGLSVYFRDVSEQKRAEQERERLLESERSARAEAERAGQLKDEFLATLSHELRTPLNAVLGWCDILNRGEPRSPEELTDGLDTIERNARAQAQIIADILDMSSIVAGKVRISVQSLDLASVIRDAIETARPAAAAKQIDLEANLDSPLTRVFGDPNRLQQVFWNLLSNAVKFTPKGGRVKIDLGRIDSHLEVRITDSGIGIKEDFLPFVFDRFRQADASTTRQYGGLGLGLSIVKQLVELHGGSILAQSRGEGHGATFVVSLPLSAVQPGTEPESARPGDHGRRSRLSAFLADGGIKGVKVLVVDDEPDARALVKRLLEDHGASVTTAASANEALRCLMASPPDVLVSDIGMPNEDGYSLIRRLRELPPEKGGAVRALALTAYARVEDRDRSILAGFQMHMPKPVDPAELIAMVATLAGSSGSLAASVQPASLASAAAKANARPSRILVVDDHAATRQALTNLLGRRQHVVVAVGSVAEARTAAEKGRFDLVISDLGLPDGSGNELMTELRNRYGLCGIALTGYGDKEAIIRSREAGFVAHLTKPVMIGALEDALVLATNPAEKGS